MTTAYVYDPIFLKHTQHAHPESARRLEAITQTLEASNLWNELEAVPSRVATLEELRTVHPSNYINRIKEFSEQGGGYLNPDTYMTPDSYQAAAIAVGSLIDLTLAVVDGQYKNGFALVRPPGHHATQKQAMGFCLFSNIAIAAKVAKKERGLERIAVIDFDVHHGNGTQDILYDDPNILFSSSHQYPYYPGSGSLKELGQGEAKGTTINFPMTIGMGDSNFKTLYTDVLIPILARFQPQLILVSAGYDAHWDDPLAQLGLTLDGLAWISKTLVDVAQDLCEAKIVFSLEGGYNLEVLGNGVANSIKSLLGRDDFVDPLGKSPWAEPDLEAYVYELKKIHQLNK